MERIRSFFFSPWRYVNMWFLKTFNIALLFSVKLTPRLFHLRVDPCPGDPPVGPRLGRFWVEVLRASSLLFLQSMLGRTQSWKSLGGRSYWALMVQKNPVETTVGRLAHDLPIGFSTITNGANQPWDFFHHQPV